jgi:hypothetical protein
MISTGRLVPEPPPKMGTSVSILPALNISTSAITQVPIER